MGTSHARHNPVSGSRTPTTAPVTGRPRLQTQRFGVAIAFLVRTCFWARAGATPIYELARREHGGDILPRHDLSQHRAYAHGLGRFGYIGVAVLLVLLGGVFAGLTIALMSQDETYLQVIATSGEGGERKDAARVLWLLKKGKHWVLVTLLLGNVITNETLPVVLDRSLGGGWPAVLCSTVLIVIFGEIAPQAICVRFGLSIGAFFSPLVLALMWIISPIAWPTAKLLDHVLGDDQHGVLYKKAGLKALVELHRSLGADRLDQDEVTIISAVLDLKEKPVGSIMTPLEDVYTMSADAVLNQKVIDVILSQGYSRIPIHAPDEPANFIGMLLVKSLITYDPKDRLLVRDFPLRNLPETNPKTSCLDVLNYFQEGKSHMMLVSEHPGFERGALGVVTLEDVVEELIGEEIIDESDVYVDVHRAIRRGAPAPHHLYAPRSSLDHAGSVVDSARDSMEFDDSCGLLASKRTTRVGGIVERVINTDGKEKIVLEARPVSLLAIAERPEQ